MSSLSDWIVNATTGQLTPSQVAQIQAEASAGVLQAGGSQADAAAAAAEVAGYNAAYSGGTATLQGDVLPGISEGLLVLGVVVVLAVVLTRKTGVL